MSEETQEANPWAQIKDLTSSLYAVSAEISQVARHAQMEQERHASYVKAREAEAEAHRAYSERTDKLLAKDEAGEKRDVERMELFRREVTAFESIANSLVDLAHKHGSSIR